MSYVSLHLANCNHVTRNSRCFPLMRYFAVYPILSFHQTLQCVNEFKFFVGDGSHLFALLFVGKRTRNMLLLLEFHIATVCAYTV